MNKTNALVGMLFACACASAPAGAADSAAQAAPFRIEAEKGEMLPDARGEKAGPYTKIPGTSGGSILAFFRDGKGVRYGKVPAAKWLVIAFSTDNGGKDATVQFFDGDKHLGDVVFPDTGDFLRIDDVEIAKLAIPAGADLRIVAPRLPVNIDYIDLYDTDEKPVVSGLRPPAPPVAELARIVASTGTPTSATTATAPATRSSTGRGGSSRTTSAPSRSARSSRTSRARYATRASTTTAGRSSSPTVPATSSATTSSPSTRTVPVSSSSRSANTTTSSPRGSRTATSSSSRAARAAG